MNKISKEKMQFISKTAIKSFVSWILSLKVGSIANSYVFKNYSFFSKKEERTTFKLSCINMFEFVARTLQNFKLLISFIESPELFEKIRKKDVGMGTLVFDWVHLSFYQYKNLDPKFASKSIRGSHIEIYRLKNAK
jgi:hypothetical protein